MIPIVNFPVVPGGFQFTWQEWSLDVADQVLLGIFVDSELKIGKDGCTCDGGHFEFLFINFKAPILYWVEFAESWYK